MITPRDTDAVLRAGCYGDVMTALKVGRVLNMLAYISFQRWQRGGRAVWLEVSSVLDKLAYLAIRDRH